MGRAGKGFMKGESWTSSTTSSSSGGVMRILGSEKGESMIDYTLDTRKCDSRDINRPIEYHLVSML